MNLRDILSLYLDVDSVGVHRANIANTVGGSSPLHVYGLVKTGREFVRIFRVIFVSWRIPRKSDPRCCYLLTEYCTSTYV